MDTRKKKTVFSKETFLTSLKDIHHNTNETKKSNIQEPDAMESVREKYKQLHTVVGSLSDKIGNVLVRQERDFLAAYRAHMYNVQKELHDMKNKMDNTEIAEKGNEKFKSLEDERDWYRKEALRLDEFSQTMKNDLKIMKEKVDSIEQDRDWLEKQLKTSKKQNKVLRAELELRLSSSNTTQVKPVDIVIKDDNKKKVMKNECVEPPNQEEYLTVFEEKEANYKKQIRNLKRELDQNRKNMIKIHSKNAKKEKLQSIDMEEFFLKCIESVKKDVLQRKTKSIDDKKNKSQSIGISSDIATNIVKTNDKPFDALPDGRMIDVHDFTSHDRVKVIEELLGYDEVLSFLYENLFPLLTKNEPNEGDMVSRSLTSTPALFPRLTNEVNEKTNKSRTITLDNSTVEYLNNRRPVSSLM